MSDVIVFEDFGLRIVVNDGVYYALYDSGESAGSFEKRSRLSKAQFDRAIIRFNIHSLAKMTMGVEFVQCFFKSVKQVSPI